MKNHSKKKSTINRQINPIKTKNNKKENCKTIKFNASNFVFLKLIQALNTIRIICSVKMNLSEILFMALYFIKIECICSRKLHVLFMQKIYKYASAHQKMRIFFANIVSYERRIKCNKFKLFAKFIIIRLGGNAHL